ncbi:MAG: hypothetical protein JST64_12200, partial [Actinobacteria bacterium]|nr:hypothetical protein [Actinomycetota bacterium]
MTPRPDRSRPERPDLRVVDGTAEDRAEDDGAPVGDAVDAPMTVGTAGAVPAAGAAGAAGDGPTWSTSPVEESRSLLAATDPAVYYKALSGLARQGHNSLLEPLAYSASLEFHDPTCVVVEPRPAGTDTIELYANAAYPQFPWLLERFRDPVVAERLDAVYQLVFNQGCNVAVAT